MSDAMLRVWALTPVVAPLLMFVALAGWMFLMRAPSERAIARVTATTFSASLVGALVIAVAVTRAEAPLVLPVGQLFSAGDYHFDMVLVLDGLSAVMLVLTATICGLVGRFSLGYLHRDAGFVRFFALLALFASAMSFLVLSGGLDQMFLGWELVGFTSWLLITFYWQRASPTRHGLRAFITYRVCDAGLLLGAALLHHFAHAAEMGHGASTTHYPIITDHVAPWQATLVALCLLFAAMGKSAQFPLSGWLPRAMEGPTPSSALFYGALSVHAGAYLLLRAEPLLHASPIARVAITVVGIATAVTATFSQRVQSDVKGALGYAVISQTGLIFVEIGLGYTQLAVFHIAAHATLRTLQLLRAPSALAAAQEIGDLSRGAVFVTGGHFAALVPAGAQRWIYRAALERFYLDTLLERFVVAPVMRLAHRLDRLEQRWSDIQCGTSAVEPAVPVVAAAGAAETSANAPTHQESL